MKKIPIKDKNKSGKNDPLINASGIKQYIKAIELIILLLILLIIGSICQ